MSQKIIEMKIMSHNRQAMDFLRQQEFDLCLSHLSKAESILTNSGKFDHLSKLYGITLNNFGCYYRRTGNLAIAQNFLRKALEILTKPPIDVHQLGGTHLNICAIVSQTGNHESALSHALIALNLFTSKYLEDPSLLTTLLVAYHNVGIEYEYLAQYSQACGVFTKALDLAVDKLGEIHPLTISLKGSLASVYKKKSMVIISPLRSAFCKPREIEPRQIQTSQISTRRSTSMARNDIKKYRFLTGERLQPMFDRDQNFSIKIGFGGKNTVPVYGEKSPKSQKNTRRSQKGRGSITDRLLTSDNDRKSQYSKSIQTDINNSSNFTSAVYNAAVIIQKNWRRYKAKQKLKTLKYQFELEKAQNDAKKALDKLKSLQEKKKQLKKSKNMKKNPSKKQNAHKFSIQACIIFIQKHVRMWIQRKKYLKIQENVIKIQKNVRKYQIQSLYKGIKEAVVFIQRWWRRVLRRRRIKINN
ncbi:hypothetical protein SteCoe_11153 [Stentor coeruleus]|uniref:Uncharacterized protein n=1 Tax=Stentor coeruleus TaxID=5963 RepID=A0A1R2CDQ9_9CILI|nr:hypothetical protein SteCoe_11153 [Stentor coeruleus]